MGNNDGESPKLPKSLGVNIVEIWEDSSFANAHKEYLQIANSAVLNTTLTNQFFTDLGLKSLTRYYIKIH